MEVNLQLKNIIELAPKLLITQIWNKVIWITYVCSHTSVGRILYHLLNFELSGKKNSMKDRNKIHYLAKKFWLNWIFLTRTTNWLICWTSRSRWSFNFHRPKLTFGAVSEVLISFEWSWFSELGKCPKRSFENLEAIE